MRNKPAYLRGSVLPTVVTVSLLMLLGMAGLLALWNHEALAAVRAARLRQARSDAESAFTLYRLCPGLIDTLRDGTVRLYDSLPDSRVKITTEYWGLYRLVRVDTADSLCRLCRLFGTEPQASQTLYYADGRSALTLAGGTRLEGVLRLPQNGLIYGRMNSDFYRGSEIPHPAQLRSAPTMPGCCGESVCRIRTWLGQNPGEYPPPADSVRRSFRTSGAVTWGVGRAELSHCRWQGRVVLLADEVRIDASCRLEQVLICARKVVVGEGACVGIQIFARDTVIVERGASLAYPSGIYSQGYAELGEHTRVDGYIIVRDTVPRKRVTANYKQARTARLRGLLWVDGAAQVQGVVAGRAVLRQAVYFSPQGYYRDLLYDVTLLENPVTALPVWEQERRMRGKEAAWVN